MGTHGHAGAGFGEVHHGGVELVLQVIGVGHHGRGQSQTAQHHHRRAQHGRGTAACGGGRGGKMGLEGVNGGGGRGR